MHFLKVSFSNGCLQFTFKIKTMSRKKAEFKEVVSFRLTDSEKNQLEEIIESKETTKSEFLRNEFQRILFQLVN
jgi:hypothetical protein